MKDRLKRQPRKYWLAYIGHALQGFVCGAAMPLIWLPYCYVNYQRAEYEAYHNRNLEHAFTAGDMVSRDIADFMLGYWCGSILTLIAAAVLLLA